MVLSPSSWCIWKVTEYINKYMPCTGAPCACSPHLVMLSQSMFPGDGSMRVRLGHELSHYWFGLLLGARDCTIS